MCGINGFNWEDKELIEKMTNEISHRGPDQYGYFTNDKVSLGHRRLSIIDLSEKGRQPMSNEEESIWVIYNGEIYNFKEIRKDLEKKGHKFKSDSDTEVIIHSYEEYGPGCVNFFNGMFAFAIYDSKIKRLILARDRLGVKPLYYYLDDKNNLIFSSEIKSILLNPMIKKELNYNSLSQLIHYAYTINGETLIKNIKELLPGHLIIYDFNKIKIIKYWELKNKIQNNSIEFNSEKLKSMLKESVKKRLVADVPLGASLSGGIDSASIVHFMSKLNNSPVKTFTVGFNDISDELNEAKKIAEFYNTEHHEIIVDFKDITKNIPKILWNAEIPFAKPAMYATYFLSKGIRERNVTIDLSGEGSDEIFGGYNRYDIYLNNQLSNFYKSKQVVSSYFPENEDKNNFFQDTVLEIDESSRHESIIKSDLDKTYKEEHLNTALNFEIKKQLPGVHLLRVDKMSMAHSHEIRVPFLDYNLVEFAMTIPSNQKWNNGDKKWVLQKAMKGLLPEEVIKRKKMPFHMPLLKYFQEEFIDVAEPILSNSSLINKIANKDYILNQIKRIKNREETEDNKLRQILFLTNLDLFNKIFIEGIKKEKLEINNFL